MKLLVTLLLFISVASPLMSQKDHGYYGNKAIIQIEGLANYPFFSNIISKELGGESYKSVNNSLVSSKDRLNCGYRATVGYAVKRNIALLFEVGQDFSNVFPTRTSISLDPNFSSDISKHEMLDIVTTSFIPKIEIAPSKALLPMGIGHQIGFGIANSKVIEQDYLYEIQNYDYLTYTSTYEKLNYSDSEYDVDPINFKKLISVKKYVFLYALSVRKPLTKNLLLNFGVRYTLNIGTNKTDLEDSYILNDQYTGIVIRSVSNHRSSSIINANIGLTFVF